MVAAITMEQDLGHDPSEAAQGGSCELEDESGDGKGMSLSERS